MRSIIINTHKYFYLYPKIKIVDFLNRIIYAIVLNFHGVQYKEHPKINGVFKISNSGKIEFGCNLIFNSTFRSNPMGLSKYCSIFVSEGAVLKVGDGSGFSGVSIFCSKEIIIGKRLFCGGNVSIWDTDFHPISAHNRVNNLDENTVVKKISIGDDVFIGANSIILKGVSIGHGSVVGAGSVVTKSIPSNEIWAGNPAKFIKFINSDTSR